MTHGKSSMLKKLSLHEREKIKRENQSVIKRVMDNNKKVKEENVKKAKSRMEYQLGAVIDHFRNKPSMNQQEVDREVQKIIESSS